MRYSPFIETIKILLPFLTNLNPSAAVTLISTIHGIATSTLHRCPNIIEAMLLAPHAESVPWHGNSIGYFANFFHAEFYCSRIIGIVKRIRGPGHGGCDSDGPLHAAGGLSENLRATTVSLCASQTPWGAAYCPKNQPLYGAKCVPSRSFGICGPYTPSTVVNVT